MVFGTRNSDSVVSPKYAREDTPAATYMALSFHSEKVYLMFTGISRLSKSVVTDCKALVPVRTEGFSLTSLVSVWFDRCTPVYSAIFLLNGISVVKPHPTPGCGDDVSGEELNNDDKAMPKTIGFSLVLASNSSIFC